MPRSRFSVVVCALLALLALPIAGQTSPAPSSAGKQTSKTPPATTKNRKRVVVDLSGFDLLESKKTQKQAVVAGATRSMPAPVALAPRLARVYSSAPVFAWDFDGKVQDFTFVLRDDQDNEVFRDDVKGRSYAYPATAPKLAAGRTYFWTVE